MPRRCLLVQWYRRYLADRDLGTYVAHVSDAYTSTTLGRMLRLGDSQARRAAVLALGWIGEADTQSVVGRSLRDRDRGVRLLSMSVLPVMWQRAAGGEAHRELVRIQRLNFSYQFVEAELAASDLLARFPRLDEAEWQLAMARLSQRDEAAAARCFRNILARNPFYYPAAAELGRYLSRQRATADAIAVLRMALRICPELESVRLQVRKLEHERRT